jgi:hypothetical protein
MRNWTAGIIAASKGHEYPGPQVASQSFNNLQAFQTYQFNAHHAAMSNPGPSRSQTANYVATAFTKGAAKDLVVNWQALCENKGQQITQRQVFDLLNDHLRGALPHDMTTVDH